MEWSDISTSLVKTTTYSDSIMIYTKDESNDAFNALIFTVAAFTNELFIASVPHKGAIAFGEVTLDWKNSIFFGQPLIDAYLLQEELIFYGIIIHASAEQKMTDNNCLWDYIINYLCPLKNGSSKHLTVYPIFLGNIEPRFQKIVKEIFDSVNKFRFKTSGYLRIYIDNTLKYLHDTNDKRLKERRKSSR
jgi:hypothetical protein